MLPEKSLRDCPEIDFICRKEFDYSVTDYAKGKPLADIPGVSFLKDGKVVHNPDAPQIQNLDALPHVTEVYKRDLDVTNYNVPFLLNPLRVALHHARLPGAVHVLLVAADVERTSVAQTFRRRRCPRDGEGQGNVAGT